MALLFLGHKLLGLVVLLVGLLEDHTFQIYPTPLGRTSKKDAHLQHFQLLTNNLPDLGLYQESLRYEDHTGLHEIFGY